MLKDILPEWLLKPIGMLKYEDLCEIRVRVNRPITLNYENTYYFLGQAGLCRETDAILGTIDLIQDIISRASNFSVYAINDEIKEGFISVKDGIRIGIAGNVVMQNGEILTTKEISSINIRIPHQIVGSAYKISKLIFDENGEIFNTLIIGAPGVGKTTILRDLCVQISNQTKTKNVLLLDERFEISGVSKGEAQLNVGSSTDIICGGKKYVNITNGIRSMSPNVIVLDEIGTMDDVLAVEYAVNCGVSVIASVHSKDIFELQKKFELERLIKVNAFKRYVVLSQKNGKGTIDNIYDEHFGQVLRFA